MNRARVHVWRNRSEIENLDRPVLQVNVHVHYGMTKVTLVLNGKEIDYELHQGEQMAIRTGVNRGYDYD